MEIHSIGLLKLLFLILILLSPFLRQFSHWNSIYGGFSFIVKINSLLHKSFHQTCKNLNNPSKSLFKSGVIEILNFVKKRYIEFSFSIIFNRISPNLKLAIFPIERKFKTKIYLFRFTIANFILLGSMKSVTVFIEIEKLKIFFMNFFLQGAPLRVIHYIHRNIEQLLLLFQISFVGFETTYYKDKPQEIVWWKSIFKCS